MLRNLKFSAILIFTSLNILGQIQIGTDIDGKNEGDQLGWSTAISYDGNIIALGASGVANNKGYVQVFKNNNGSWQQIGSDIEGDNEGDYFGHAVSLSDDGTILAISAYNYSNNDNNYASNNYGEVKVFKFENNSWIQLGTNIFEKFTFSSSSKDQNDLQFGYSLDLNSDGTILAIGAPKADLLLPIHLDDIPNCGLVAIYKFENNDWNLKKTIFGEAEEDNSGNSISLNSDGTILAIGAANNDGNGNNSGHVRVYREDQQNEFIWIQTGNENIENGKDINGENAFDLFGFSVSLSGDGVYIAAGAPANDGDNGNRTDSGQVVSYYNGGTLNDDSYYTTSWFNGWQEIDGKVSVDQFGYSVSMSDSGGYLAVGSIDNDDNGFKSGQVRIFRRGIASFNKLGLDINGEASGDQAGFSVSLSGDASKVVIGAPFNDGNGGNSGHVRVYDLSAILSTNNIDFSQFNIFPNPVKNNFTINLKDNLELKKVSIYNNLGQLTKTSKELTINTSNLKSGIYFVEIETNKGKSTKKVIIE